MSLTVKWHLQDVKSNEIVKMRNNSMGFKFLTTAQYVEVV